MFHFSPITADKGGVGGRGRNQHVCLCKKVTERLPRRSPPPLCVEFIGNERTNATM